MIKTILCDMLNIKYPILQGGMAWVSTWELTAAVSEGGGLGIIGAGNAPADFVRDQIRKTKEHTDKPFGVNIPLFSLFIDEIVKICIEEKVAVVTTGAGNPGPIIAPLKAGGVKVIPVLASVALAKRLERQGVDAVVAEGMESGGHIGDVGTFPLVPQIVDAVKIPVIAAGGIADGRGLAAALAMGAVGIQMGTRFICTTECYVHANYKNKIVSSGDRATVTTGHSLGHPVRAIRNEMTNEFAELERKGISEADLIAFGTGKLRAAAVNGDVVQGSVMAGQSCGLISDILPAAEVIQRTMREAEEAIARAAKYSVA